MWCAGVRNEGGWREGRGGGELGKRVYRVKEGEIREGVEGRQSVCA